MSPEHAGSRPLTLMIAVFNSLITASLRRKCEDQASYLSGGKNLCMRKTVTESGKFDSPGIVIPGPAGKEIFLLRLLTGKVPEPENIACRTKDSHIPDKGYHYAWLCGETREQ